ncbi:MAG: hypothetical protein ACREJ0_30120, partial [Geminicoccaceae bacterium]
MLEVGFHRDARSPGSLGRLRSSPALINLYDNVFQISARFWLKLFDLRNRSRSREVRRRQGILNDVGKHCPVNPCARSLPSMPTRAFLPGVMFASAILAAGPAFSAPQTLTAQAIDHPIRLDGQVHDWQGVTGIIVPLSGEGGADRAELRAAIRGDRIYVLAIWDDPSESDLHKPYRWNEASHTYEKTDAMEDRFAISMRMSGDFTANKLDGSEFRADVWHWKAHRSNQAGLAHDKSWRVSRTPFERSRAFQTASGETVH